MHMLTDLEDTLQSGEEFPGCCGITVTYDFPAIKDLYPDFENEEDRPVKRAEVLADFIKIVGKPGNHLVLISLIDSQLRDGWKGILKEARFRLLFRFRNGAGNIVNLYGQGLTNVPAYKGKPRPKKAIPGRIEDDPFRRFGL